MLEKGQNQRWNSISSRHIKEEEREEFSGFREEDREQDIGIRLCNKRNDHAISFLQANFLHFFHSQCSFRSITSYYTFSMRFFPMVYKSNLLWLFVNNMYPIPRLLPFFCTQYETTRDVEYKYVCMHDHQIVQDLSIIDYEKCIHGESRERFAIFCNMDIKRRLEWERDKLCSFLQANNRLLLTTLIVCVPQVQILLNAKPSCARLLITLIWWIHAKTEKLYVHISTLLVAKKCRWLSSHVDISSPTTTRRNERWCTKTIIMLVWCPNPNYDFIHLDHQSALVCSFYIHIVQEAGV